MCVGDRLDAGSVSQHPGCRGLSEKQLWTSLTQEGRELKCDSGRPWEGSVCSFRGDGGGGRNKNPQSSLQPGTSSLLGTVSWPPTTP